MRFQRNYEITIQTPNGIELNITPPLTAKISLTRNTLASANSCSLQIVNLKKSTRSQIYKDRYALADYWQMIIRAGYGDQLYEIFRGNIYEAYSTKSGTDWTTYITAMDGMYAIQNGVTAQSYNNGITIKGLIQNVITDMPNMIEGVISGTMDTEKSRGGVLFGPSNEVMGDLTGGQHFIDSETLNVLTTNEVIGKYGVIVLDASMRKSTPKRRDSLLETVTLFTPQVAVGGYAEIRGGEDIYAGQYKILGFSHNITISQAEPGNAETTITLDAGSQALEAI